MKTEKIKFLGANNVVLPGIIWMPETTPVAVLQITHGMTEHIGRYTALAEELTAHGITVAGFDLRGHGKNPGNPECASFGKNGWEASLEDMHLFYDVLQKRFAEIPHFMLGFSLGSFLLREYMNQYSDEVAGAVIMGTGYQPQVVLSVMMVIVKTQIKKAGFDETTALVKQLSFETYNQKFKPNRTPSDWLCADENQLDAYCADTLCRKNISAGLFWQLLGSMKRTGEESAYAHCRKDMPVLLLSGQEDPVGDFSKGVSSVKARMEKAGMNNVQIHLFKGARHDLLHEEESGCASQCRKMIQEWIQQKIRQKIKN